MDNVDGSEHYERTSDGKLVSEDCAYSNLNLSTLEALIHTS